jgi:hypothetical protein
VCVRRPQIVGLRSLGIDGRKGLGVRESSHRAFEWSMCLGGGHLVKMLDLWFYADSARVYALAHVCVSPETCFFPSTDWPFGM